MNRIAALLFLLPGPVWCFQSIALGKSPNVLLFGAEKGNDIQDADFERVDPAAAYAASSVVGKKEKAKKKKKKKGSKTVEEAPKAEIKDPFTDGMSILDAFLQNAKESEFGDLPIEFFTQDEQTIDCTLACTIDLDGQLYGLGVPKETAVTISIEGKEGTTYADPDDDENKELMEIMAGALQKHLSEDLRLKRTPRVLTVEGDLDKHTNNFINEIFGVDKLGLDDFLDAGDPKEDLDFFYDFFKKELGEETFDNIMSGKEKVDIDPSLLALVDQGLEESDMSFLKDIDVNDVEQSMDVQNFNPEQLIKDMNPEMFQEGVGLKLLTFKLKDGNSYSLIKHMKPPTVVGRKSDEKFDVRFELLTEDEAKVIIPRLEEVAKLELKASDLLP